MGGSKDCLNWEALKIETADEMVLNKERTFQNEKNQEYTMEERNKREFNISTTQNVQDQLTFTEGVPSVLVSSGLLLSYLVICISISMVAFNLNCS